MSGGRVPVASSLLSRSMGNLDHRERQEALSMLITIGLSYYQQCYGDVAVDLNELKQLYGKLYLSLNQALTNSFIRSPFSLLACYFMQC